MLGGVYMFCSDITNQIFNLVQNDAKQKISSKVAEYKLDVYSSKIQA
jgi:hypothetical protein